MFEIFVIMMSLVVIFSILDFLGEPQPFTHNQPAPIISIEEQINCASNKALVIYLHESRGAFYNTEKYQYALMEAGRRGLL